MRPSFVVLLCLIAPVQATDLLITNVRIFNGVDSVLTAGHVAVTDGLIDGVYSRIPEVDSETRIIDGGNRVLSPGFIDIHSHFGEQYPFKYEKSAGMVHGVYAGKAAEFYLNSGFTATRDAGGTSPDLAKIIAAGDLAGPRLFASGPYIGQTSGHGDFRLEHEANPLIMGQSPYLNHGESILADGTAQVLTATREALRQGATQIKIMGGGGVMSAYDPIHTIQYTPDEIRAAVQAASDWGTYVMAHAYTSASIKRLVENGVRSIEHGLLIDDATAKMVAEANVVLSTQVYLFSPGFGDVAGMSEEMRAKQTQVRNGQKSLISLIKKYRIKTGFGTDFAWGEYNLLGMEFVARAEYWTPFEILKQATSESAEIIRMAGPLISGPEFGEIRPGWAADMILLNGEPQQDIRGLRDLQGSVALVIKGGEVVVERMQ